MNTGSKGRSSAAEGWIEGLEARAYLLAGGLDPGFGAGGKVTTDFIGAQAATANAVAVQADGKLIAAGVAKTDFEHEDAAIVRYNADGSIDTSFGDGGQVVVDYGGAYAEFDEVRVLPGGKILAAGFKEGRLLVTRFLPDGRADATFGTGGRYLGSQTLYGPMKMAIATDGSILLAAHSFNESAQASDLVVVRLRADGAPDSSFGQRGTATVDTGGNESVGGLATRDDGRVLIAGQWTSRTDYQTHKIVLAQLRRDGSPDPTFAGSGQVVGHIFAGDDDIRDIALDALGRALLLNADFTVARFRADGIFDRSFAVRGVRHVVLPPTKDSNGRNTAARIVLQDDGRIVVDGTFDAYAYPDRGKLAVVRLTTDGAMDGGFDADGIALVPLEGQGTGLGLAIQANHRIVAVGQSGGTFVAVRLNPNGSLDNPFGTLGRAKAVVLSSGNDPAWAMTTLADGKIVVAGSTQTASSSKVAVARYNRDGSPDTSFGIGGHVRLDALGEGMVALLVVPTASGGLIVGGFGPIGIGFVARLRGDGLLDTSFGAGGKVAFAHTVNAARVLADGRIVVEVGNYGTNELRWLRADGSPDMSAAQGSVLALEGLRVIGQNAMILTVDGKILLAAAHDRGGDQFGDTVVLRVNPDGRVDPTFGNNGQAEFEFGSFWGDSPAAVAVQSDGKIVVAGRRTQYAGSDYAAARLNANGSLDTTFGDHGVATTALPPSIAMDFGISTDYALAVAVTDDGKIILAGHDDVYAQDGALGLMTSDFGIVRYNVDGSLDNGFGDGGTLRTSFGREDTADAMAITADGKLLVAGTGQPNPTGNDFALAQYFLVDPNPISVKVEGGTLVITGTAAADAIRLRVVNGRLVILGVTQSFAVGSFSKIRITGAGGDDVIDASAATVPVSIDGGEGADSILGGQAADIVVGGAGDDTLFGGGGADTLRGGDGNDYLNGGPGADSVFGDAGNDQLFALDAARDTIDGGGGLDRLKGDAVDLLHDTEWLL
ncbi:MAG TPA: hypothetical protein VH475_13805 [Tepidisphaeraceae bacterium]